MKAPEKVAAGRSVYELGQPPCSAKGITWTEAELDAGLAGHVAALVFDYEVQAMMAELVSPTSETEFPADAAQNFCCNPERIENSQVGEAIAQAYLSDHYQCTFPWPMSRDQRKIGSSLPGADLVGFVTDPRSGRKVMAFGEVKTSAQHRHPPSVIYGDKGLTSQLADLRDRCYIRDPLVMYLLARAANASWKAQFIEAWRNYINDRSNVRIYGVLIRDVNPDHADLSACAETLAAGCPENTAIMLLAIYLPSGRIATLNARIADRSGL